MRMGRSSSKPRNQNCGGQCKKHPKHKQSPGVCSLCLTEKLSRVSTSSSRYAAAMKGRARAYYCSSSSLSSSEDSSYVSTPGSPVLYHRRIVSDVRPHDPVSLTLSRLLNNDGFGKSRSMANRGFGGSNKKNAISGFWSKLLGPRRNNNNNNNKSSHLTNKMLSQSQPLGANTSTSMLVY